MVRRRRATQRLVDRETPVSVRLTRSVLTPIRAKARASGKPVSRVIKEMLESVVRMQRFPGIVFVEGPAGRRAHLAGTGLDVWEVVRLLQEHQTAAKLRESFPRLSPIAIQIAQAYAESYPDEVNAFIEMNDQSPRVLREKLPWLEIAPS
jgi:uncharacterized protein (DUF433 family)